MSPDKRPRWRSGAAVWINNSDAYLAATDITPAGDPNTYEYAVSAPDRELWQMAMEEEIQCLNDNGTWELCDLPKDRKTVKCRWVYVTKRDTQGNAARHRARLVAKGFSQAEGIDYEETFAPVARLDSLRLLLAIAARLDLDAHHIDIKSAYLNGILDEDIYMDQPKGFAVTGKENQVCHLKKALYGLKQAGRQWHAHLFDTLEGFGFRKNISGDTSIFIKRHDGGDPLIILVYVDDIALFGVLADISTFKTQIAMRYKISDLGEITQFLGLHVVRDRSKKTLTISQGHYIQRILQRFDMLDCTPAFTPLAAGIKLEANPDETPDYQLRTKYQQVVGSLMYAMLGTRPDICFAVNRLAQYGSNPSKLHLNSAMHVLRYLKHTQHYALLFGKNDCEELIGFTDSDWAADTDDRRSTTGYCYTFTGGCVAWQTRKQRTVALSSTEAEYMALTECAKHGQWTTQLLEQLDFDVDPIPLFTDSLGAKAIAENPVHHGRTKHIDIRHHYVRDAVSNGTFNVSTVGTKDNVADILTKSFSRDRHEFLTEKLGIVGCSIAGECCKSYTLEQSSTGT